MREVFRPFVHSGSPQARVSRPRPCRQAPCRVTRCTDGGLVAQQPPPPRPWSVLPVPRRSSTWAASIIALLPGPCGVSRMILAAKHASEANSAPRRSLQASHVGRRDGDADSGSRSRNVIRPNSTVQSRPFHLRCHVRLLRSPLCVEVALFDLGRLIHP